LSRTISYGPSVYKGDFLIRGGVIKRVGAGCLDRGTRIIYSQLNFLHISEEKVNLMKMHSSFSLLKRDLREG
jgi:hypothetical protein